MQLQWPVRNRVAQQGVSGGQAGEEETSHVFTAAPHCSHSYLNSASIRSVTAFDSHGGSNSTVNIVCRELSCTPAPITQKSTQNLPSTTPSMEEFSSVSQVPGAPKLGRPLEVSISLEVLTIRTISQQARHRVLNPARAVHPSALETEQTL